VALAGKLQLIPKLRMKSNCSLAHSVVLRSALSLACPFSPSLSYCFSVVQFFLSVFCFYILLTADYSSCSVVVSLVEGQILPLLFFHPYSPECMIFILCLSFIFLMFRIPSENSHIGYILHFP